MAVFLLYEKATAKLQSLFAISMKDCVSIGIETGLPGHGIIPTGGVEAVADALTVVIVFYPGGRIGGETVVV